MIFGQNLISILLSKPDKQADMQMSFFGADPLPKTPDHQKKFVAHQNSDFFILSYALMASNPNNLFGNDFHSTAAISAKQLVQAYLAQGLGEVGQLLKGKRNLD